ncbi:hypothetical protein [Sphingomonas sp. LM7]|uniref:hypothetical protein n=1 Tax=Sphingomonas sp. LM7 TaxID=1938607 RepID=UPI000983B53F|nr:hypothetical protein [Sphingomonas sp. LM7]AQR75080.1 hypothetical protein BXU08_16700 [Sphingomonas sp. LM7]
MGKRNSGLVGTHEDYFADMLDENTGSNPSIVRACASAEDAATSYFQNVFENSNARIRTAIVAVWPVACGRDKQLVFDASAAMTPSEAADADPGEFDVSLNVSQRR